MFHTRFHGRQNRAMPVKKLSKKERFMDEQMLALLEWALSTRTRAQHRQLRGEPEGGGAARLARRAGDMAETNMFRLKPKK
jgi:hypothetical protein